MKESGYLFEWLNEKNDLQLISDRALPAIRVTRSGRKSFCNAIIAVFKGWIDENNSPDKCLKFGNLSDMPTEIVEDICRFADENKVSISWKKGDFMLIEN